MVDALAVLLRARRLLAALALLGVVLATAYLFLIDRSWSSTALFMPQTRRLPSNLTGLAAQIGIAIPANDGGLSPAFYADLIRTDVILAPLAAKSYPTSSARDQRPLVDILRISGSTPEARRTKAQAKLARMIFPSVSAKTGVVTLLVKTNDPLLSSTLAERILTQVDSFNQGLRHSQASAERRFTEQRVAQTQSELRSAEDRLQYFLQRNREYESSPELSFQKDRLQREVNLRQDVYTQLVQLLEQAKVDEVRDTPVLTIVQSPETPVLPDSRGLLTGIVLGAFLGVFVGCVLALVRARLTPSTADATVESPLAREGGVPTAPAGLSAFVRR